METVSIQRPLKKILLSLAIILLLPVSDLSGQTADIYSRPVQDERSHDYDALHYRAEFHFDTGARRLSGTNEMKIRSLRNGFDRCLFDAGPNITIETITGMDGEPLEFVHEDDKVMLMLAEDYEYNDTLSFIIQYYAVNPVDDQKIFYDETEMYPSMIWGPNFPNRVRNWMPCYDFPNDKVSHEMIIHAPEGMKAVSNGELVSVTEDAGGGSAWHWEQVLPHSTYLFVLAVGPYLIFEDNLGDLPVNYWVFPRDSASVHIAFGRTPGMIDFFNDLFDYEYPWAKADQVMIPHMGGAAESTTATLYSNGMIINMDEKGLKDYSFDRIIAHEVAHHWWGDLITLRTWSETWLNESFGTYCDHIWTSRTLGHDAGIIDLEGKKNAYLNEAHNRYIRPIVFDRYNRESPGQNFDRHTYQKGALMLHLLRSMLGDDIFFRTLSYFLHKHAFKPVDTYDFMKAIKEISGQNMDWFFEQFFFRPGHPVFQVHKTWNKDDKMLQLKISQVQDTVKGVPYAYRIPVKIGFYTDEGKTVKQLWLDKREEEFSFPLEEEPLMVKFDDEGILLKELIRDIGEKELLYKLRNDDIVGRAEAATIAASGIISEVILNALLEATQNDDSWYVRKAALRSLAGTGYVKIAELCIKMATDPDSEVRTSAIRILGDTGDDGLVTFFRERFKDDESYMVQAECVRSIGKCGSRQDIEFLEEAGRLSSTRNVISVAARNAISDIKNRE